MSKPAAFGSFSDLSSIKGNTVEKPKNLPDGFYSALITGPFKENKAKTGNFSMRYPVKLVEALDPENAETIASNPLLQKSLERDYHIDFWMSPDARWRFTDFCKAMGIDDEQDLLSMGEALVALGEPFLVRGASGEPKPGEDQGFFGLDNPAPLSNYQG